MDFQYIDGTDNYYSLYERLLALFQIGMKEYLKEDVFYLDNDYIRKTLDQFTGKKRKELEEELVDKFQKTKMLSCQVFAFREVYNEKLFLQNGKVLVEVVELFQNYKLAYTSKDQFLGELFENLLDQGFKQEAGQFFTPVPITRFVWNSLPLDRYLTSKVLSLPKVIDFACGSGHFLTEGVSAIADNLDGIDDKTISDSFYGIDKDNRLARVSKVAMLLNGASNAHIKPGDGLEHDEDFLGELHSFDILVANPPYSVDAFKTHESRKVQNTYETIKLMSLDCKDIQNVFIERMHHLLKPKGIAAIVMPSSLLSNTDVSDIKTREILLNNFFIRCIASFGGNTFGKTSTNTIILFLEHYDFPPQKAKLLKDSASAIVNGENLDDWNDSDLFNKYLKTIDTQKESYLQFFSKTESLFENSFAPYFKEYESVFRNRTNTKKILDKITENERKEKNKHRQKRNEKNSDELKQTLNNDFFDWVKETEENKLLIFSLTYQQQTLIITSPTDNNEQKRFLGYTNSERRRREGLQENGGLLTNKSDRNDKQKLAWLVRNAFAGIQYNNNELGKYASFIQTSNMFDYSRATFDMQISLFKDKKIIIDSKYPIVKLGGEDGVCDIKIGGTPSRANLSFFSGKNLWVSIAEMNGQIIQDTKEKITDEAVRVSNVKLIPKGTTLLSFKLSIGKVAIAGKDLYTNEAIAALIPKDKGVLSDEFLFALFKGGMIDLENVGNKAFGKSLNSTYLKEEIKIPLPPIEVQRQIALECKKVDEEYNRSRMGVDQYRQKIADVFDRLGVVIVKKDGEQNAS